MKRVLLMCMIALMAACSTNDDVQRTSSNQMYTLVFETQDVPQSVSVYAVTNIDYVSGFDSIESPYDYVNNTVTVVIQPGAEKIESSFYIEDGSEVTIILYNDEGNVVSQQVIEQTNYNYTYEF